MPWATSPSSDSGGAGSPSPPVRSNRRPAKPQPVVPDPPNSDPPPQDVGVELQHGNSITVNGDRSAEPQVRGRSRNLANAPKDVARATLTRAPHHRFRGLPRCGHL